MDRISELPNNVIENILIGIPLRDAIRTSVLSRNWQYKWTRIPLLTLDNDSLSFSIQTGNDHGNFGYLHKVNSILVQHNGPIEDFLIEIPELHGFEKYFIRQSIRAVLNSGVHKLTILNLGRSPFLWPSSFPSSPSLIHLALHSCAFKQNPNFQGFENVECLIFDDVTCSSDTLSKLISNSPNLQRIYLQNLICARVPLIISAPKLEYLYIRGGYETYNLENVPNLKRMEIYVLPLSKVIPWEITYLNEVFDHLRRLEWLMLGNETYKLFEKAGQLRMLPKGLEKLQLLKLTEVDFNDIAMLRTILCFMRSATNLCELKLFANRPTNSRLGEINLDEDIESNFTFDNLEMVHLGPISGVKTEMEMIKFLLHCSPSLQMMYITYEGNLVEDVVSFIADELAQFHCASTSVKIEFVNKNLSSNDD